VLRSGALFVAAALTEIGGVFLIWRAAREDAGAATAIAGTAALAAYGWLATLQSDPHFGRVLAAYGGVFVVGSLVCGVALDHFKPDRLDLVGIGVCIVGVALIMWGPR
jgi:small multidrug resistance family-3 protein